MTVSLADSERARAARAGRRRLLRLLFSRTAWTVYVVIVLAWLVFPMLLIVLSSFQGQITGSLSLSHLSLADYRAIPPEYWSSLVFSIEASAIATVVSIAVAVPAAWGMVRGKLRERRFISLLVLLPESVPLLILGVALLTIFLRFQLNDTPVGIIIALVGISLAISVRLSEAVLEGIPEEYELAAQTLGASRFTAFRTILLPLVIPGIVIAMLFTFMAGLVSFVLLFFIAGPDAMPVSVRLFSDIVDQGVLPQAVAMSAILVFVALLFYAVVAVVLGPKFLTGATMSRKG